MPEIAEVRLSARAEADIASISEYTLERFGIEQALHYRDALESCLNLLAQNRMLGRRAERLAPSLRSYQHQSHTIYYIPDGEGIYVVRILHVRMDPLHQIAW